MEVLEQREISHSIIQHLKASGIKIKGWKRILSEHQEKSSTLRIGLYGIPRQAEIDEAVPRFIVDACEFLSQHLHTEGLFRKSGSMIRIKALKMKLDSGSSCLDSALPCDVASLLKQFLRDLPEPLIMPELQEPLCRVQQLAGESERMLSTILITYLLPRPSANTLRYFCTFLQKVASRCEDNKMPLSNLAVVIAPNLFRHFEVNEKLTGVTERHLHLPVAVVQTLVTHASEIGCLPQFYLEKIRPVLDQGNVFSTPAASERGGNNRLVTGGSSGQKRHRQSMGERVNGALNKLISGRTPFSTQAPTPPGTPLPDLAPCSTLLQDCSPSNSPGLDRMPSSTALPDTKQADVLEPRPTLSTSFKAKRKSSEDAIQGLELSAKKRKPSMDTIEDEFLAGHGHERILATSKVHATQYHSFSHMPVSPGDLREHSPVTSLLSTPNVRTKSSIKRRSSNKQQEAKRVQRKYSGKNKCASPAIKRKDQGRKSLRLFHRSGKTQDLMSPLTPDTKTLEPSGWNFVKKKVAEAFEGPIFATKDPRSSLRKDEPANGLSRNVRTVATLSKMSFFSEEDTDYATAGVQSAIMPEIGLKSQQTTSAAELQSPTTWRKMFRSRQPGSCLSQGGHGGWKAGDILRDRQSSGIRVFRKKSVKPGVLRRSLSLPDNISEAVENELSQALCESMLASPQGCQELWESMGCDVSFPKADALDGKLRAEERVGHCITAESVSGSMEAKGSVHLHTPLEVSLMPCTLTEQVSIGNSFVKHSEMSAPHLYSGVEQHAKNKRLENPSPYKLKNSLFTHNSEAETISTHHLRSNHSLCIGLRKLSLNLSSPEIEPPVFLPTSMEPRQRTLRRQGARRYGRSLSHESALAIRAAVEADACVRPENVQPYSVEANMPLLSMGNNSLQPCETTVKCMKECSRQIFVSRKNITLVFGGHRIKKEQNEPTVVLDVLPKDQSLGTPVGMGFENFSSYSETQDTFLCSNTQSSDTSHQMFLETEKYGHAAASEQY